MRRRRTRTYDAPGNPPPFPDRLGLEWVVVFLCGCALYAATCAPDVLEGDAGAFQFRAVQFPSSDVKDTVALVNRHLVYLAIAKAFTWLPIGNPAYCVNLVSSCFGAMALANVFVIVRILTASRWAAAIGALSVALGHTFWMHAAVAECLTLCAAFLTAELLVLTVFARTGKGIWFISLGLINGLAISNHMMAALGTPVYALLAIVWWQRGRLRASSILGFAVTLLAGAGIYLSLVIQTMIRTGEVIGVVVSATTGNWPAANLNVGASMILRVLGYVALQYPTLLCILGIVALWAKPLYSRDILARWALVGVLGVHFVFAARYPVPDQFAFFVPFYAAFGVMIGLGARDVIRRWRPVRWVCLVLAIAPVGVYFSLPALARRFAPELFTGDVYFCEPYAAYCDPYVHFLRPWQCGNDGPRRHAEAVFDALPPDAVLVADFVSGTSLSYLQAVEGERPDVTLTFSHRPFPIATFLRASGSPPPPRWTRPVYAVGDKGRYVPPPLDRGFRFVREGVLYRVDTPERWPNVAPR